MAFLDNSSNIIIDVCVTDEGRRRLARGDGSFKISKFAVFSDEIDFGQYSLNHQSGSAYYDLAILQTPILEAFTNNTSYGNAFGLTIPRTNLLYLPVIKINEVFNTSTKMNAAGAFLVAVDSDTEASFKQVQGVIMGETLNGGSIIRCDQGLDTDEIPPAFTLDADLVETQYLIEIDNRFGKIISTDGVTARLSFIDDDNIAAYYLSLGTDAQFVSENLEKVDVDNNQTIRGPRGTILQFKIASSIELNSSTYLFNQLGSTTSMTGYSGAVSVYYIDAVLRITGATTGYRVDVPVRFIKNV